MTRPFFGDGKDDSYVYINTNESVTETYVWVTVQRWLRQLLSCFFPM